MPLTAARRSAAVQCTSGSDAPALPALAFVLVAVPFVLLSLLYFQFRVDDAFIVLRYADNLRRGNGLTFNPGERVEGFTCPALVVLEAAVLALGGPALLATKLLGIAAGLCLLWTTMALALRMIASRTAAVFAGALLAVQPALAVAAVNGLETLPFAACSTAALALYLRATRPGQLAAAGALLGLSVLARPEGGLAFGLVAVDLLLRRRARLFSLLGPFALVAAPPLLWKAAYYGALAPNTALAKVPALLGPRLASGAQYLLELSVSHWDAAAWLALLWLAAAGVDRFRTLAWVAFPWLAYVVWTGGDWMPQGRFLVPLLPLASLGLSGAVHRLWTSQTAARPWVPCLVIGAVLLPALAFDIVRVGARQQALTEATLVEALPLGRWLRESAPQATVALLDIGAVGYVSGLRIIDTGGLTDPVIARIIHDHGGHYAAHLYMPDATAARAIADETFARRPELLVAMMRGAYPRAGGAREGAYPQDSAILGDQRLARDYRYVCHVPGSQELDGSRWDYNVFARASAVLRAAPTVAPGGDLLCQ